MAITHVNSANIIGNGTHNVSITIPAGTGIQAGDLIVGTFVTDGTHVVNGGGIQDSVNGVSYSPLGETDQTNSSSFWQESKYYITPNAIADGSTFTVTGFFSSATVGAAIDIFRGLAGIIDQPFVGPTNSSPSTTITGPALGGNAVSGALVLSMATGEGATTLSQSTLTTGSVNTSGRNVGIAYLLAANGLSTYAVTWTQGVSGSWAAQAISFSPTVFGPPNPGRQLPNAPYMQVFRSG